MHLVLGNRWCERTTAQEDNNLENQESIIIQ